DILSELEPRLKSLERQSRKALEYEQLRADLQVCLREWYGFHWTETQGRLLKAQEIFNAQNTRLEEARQRLAGVDSLVDDSRGRLRGLREHLGQWHTQSAELHRQREQISRALAVRDERHRALIEQRQASEGDRVRLEEEYQARSVRSVSMQQEQSRLQSELAEAQNRLEEAREKLAARHEERRQVGDLLRESRQALVASETRLVQLKARYDEVNNRLESLQVSLQSLSADINNAEEGIHRSQVLVEDYHRQKAESEKALQQEEQSRQEVRRQLEEWDTRRKEIARQQMGLEAERARLQAQVEVLEQAERSFSGLNQGARLVLEAAQKKSITGGYQALSSLMEVPAEYETAIAAVLGESLDGVLLDERSDLESVLRLLEVSDRGRAVLYPLTQVKPTERLRLPSDHDVVGLAADLITAPAPYASLVNLLLGKVVVVTDRAAAQRMVKSIPDTARVVTLKGEVFWGNGMVTAGRDGRAGMIARPRQKRELQDSQQGILRDLTQLAEKLAALEMEQTKRQAALRELEKRVEATRRENERVSRTSQQAGLELQQAVQRATWQKEQLAAVEDQIQKSENIVAEVKKELEARQVQIADHNSQVRERSRLLASIPLDEFQAEVTHWTTNAAVTTRALQDATERQKEITKALNESQTQQTSLQNRLDQITASLTQLESDRELQLAQEGTLTEEIEALRLKIEPTEQELETLERQYFSQQAEQSSVQQAVSAAERLASQAQVELIRQREALDALRRRIEDDLGLVDLEYTSQVTGPTPLPFGELVKALPKSTQISPDLDETINRQKMLMRRMGAINPEARSEFQSVQERFEFMSGQLEDLRHADADLRRVILELDELMKLEFRKTFDAVAEEFRHMFTRLFGGGSARLVLVDEDNPVDTGVDIEAKLPGRREQGLALLSGGERSLTAVALIFSLLKVSPTPFCVLDEVDAMLDEANVGRFCELLNELSEHTQFILITHNRNTVQTADVIYGVTMGRDSASQVISLKMDELSEAMMN
ncbi:MAG: chromosome segregation protein SMC, partial [Anaerolineaceae bacterium]|nr:chromosome segregation protein SMC [Anaerolineaceae bacterium]